MSELYKGITGSPITYLAADISAGQTTISIADDTALPDAPNICTIGYGEQLETIKYGQKSNGVLQEVVRGIEGVPRAWQAGTEVARFFTAYDHNSIIEEFIAHKAESANKHIANSGTIGDGHYIKFDDGTMKYYGSFVYTGPCYMSVGTNMFRTNSGVAVPATPVDFVGDVIKKFFTVPYSSGTDAIILGIQIQSKASRVDIFTPIAHDSITVKVGFEYLGRWK